MMIEVFIYLFIYSNKRFYISGTHLIDGAFTMWYTDKNKQDNNNMSHRGSIRFQKSGVTFIPALVIMFEIWGDLLLFSEV